MLRSWSRKFWKGQSRIFYLRLRNPASKCGLCPRVELNL